MNGAESLARTLVAADISVCFANPGTSEMHFVAALDRVGGLRCILGLAETVVTGSADGYARMAEKPAVTLLHCGPGLANGIANLHFRQLTLRDSAHRTRGDGGEPGPYRARHARHRPPGPRLGVARARHGRRCSTGGNAGSVCRRFSRSASAARTLSDRARAVAARHETCLHSAPPRPAGAEQPGDSRNAHGCEDCK